MPETLRPSHQGFELLLAVGLTIAAELELWSRGLLGTPAQGATAALVTLPLALRFRAPLLTMAVVAAALVAEALSGVHSGAPIIPIVAALLALYAVGSRTEGWRFWTGGALALVAGCATTLIREGASTDLIAALATPAVGLMIGRALGVLRLESDVFEERASRLERERDAHAKLAVAEERSRIARELHDIIGHSISVMGVQAGAVRRVLNPDQQREREMLLAVEQVGRQAVGEMRRLIGLLRTDESGIGDSRPSLRRVEQLVAEMRQAGLAVEMRVEGELGRLPPGPDLAGYRILQEALTNALKHAPGADVSAAVRCNGEWLEIEVLNASSGTRGPRNGNLGHGLLGMRERTSLYGGNLTTGMRRDGGFAVRARIPLEAL
jgi:signal transduction histidine kinase